MQLLSIIIPVYNVSKYLEQCLNSVINQKYENIEIILINDGSTDDSLDICKRYGQMDKRITLLSIPNQGLAYVKNLGLDIANGDLIAFVDSDDYVHEDIYVKMIECMKQEDSDIVICDYQEVDEKGNYIFSKGAKHKTKGNITGQDNILGIIYQDYIKTVVSWNKLYKKRVLENIRFPNGKKYEDNYMIHRILNNTSKLCLLDEKMYYYRKRSGSITYSINCIDRWDEVRAVDDRVYFYEMLGVRKELLYLAVKESLRKRIILYYNVLKDREIKNKNIIKSKVIKEFKEIVQRYCMEFDRAGLEFRVFLYFPMLASAMNAWKMKK